MTEKSTVFLSYAHIDDDDRGIVGWLTGALESELKRQTGTDWSVFQDARGIKFGQPWQTVIRSSVASAGFFVFLLSPSYFQSDSCREELEVFLRREEQLDRPDLIFPLRWIAPRASQKTDNLVKAALARQYIDISGLRHADTKSEPWRAAVSNIAGGIIEAADRGTPISKKSLKNLLQEMDLLQFEESAARRGGLPHYPQLAELHKRPFELFERQLRLAEVAKIEDARQLLPEFQRLGLEVAAEIFAPSRQTWVYAVAEDILVMGAGVWAARRGRPVLRWRKVFVPEIAAALGAICEANAPR